MNYVLSLLQLNGARLPCHRLIAIAVTSLAPLLQQYRAAASQHGQATATGDASAANRQYEQLTRAYRAIQQHGKEAVVHLLPLLNDGDWAVATWAATHLLPSHEPAATAALQRISQQPGIMAFGAQMVLQEWKNGRLRLE
ncbi:hypothetical protein I2I05_21605 [Hymenobacter sp. BT683]|uniref:DUF2019 domain-containing protein n=1 Tax=Hymenobacter jeongseonensis TaxID=2791027 RepID=A0ABS0INP7_9BACT|nr:hypothetical protein [Hymenobacter jeongseonensis]MBF9240001.1 hypothetical protein [Hymenobacter jeongseonensis]